jgi:hypothetical protein
MKPAESSTDVAGDKTTRVHEGCAGAEGYG